MASLALVSLASMIVLFTNPPPGLLPLGPSAVDAHLETELAVLFGPRVVETSQRLLHVVGLTVFIGLASVLVTRRSGSNRAPLAAITIAALGTSLFAPTLLLPGGETIARVVGAITPETLSVFWGSLAGIATLAFLSTFPGTAWAPVWTRWLVGLALLSGVAGLVLPNSPLSPNSWPTSVRTMWLVLVPATAITAQMVRRKSRPFADAAKPVVISLIVALGAFLVLWILQPELTPGVLDLIVVTPRLRAVYALNVLLLLTAAVLLFPTSVSVAIVRHRLFDLDLLVNRALVYGTVTALIGVIFLAVATGAAIVAGVPLRTAIGGWAAGPIGVALGTCLVLAFQPLRQRVQRGVDRRFYRERYDARQLIDRFAGQAARLIDPAFLESELVSVVEKALRPKRVILHTESFAEEVERGLDSGVAIDISQGPSSAGLERFAVDGSAVLVPLVAGGALTGLLDLGAKASGTRYSSLDLDLLDRLAQSAGPALQLAHELHQREREAQDRERASHELELARKIQQGLLPHGYPTPHDWGFEALYRPAREVGGDFYDWIDLSDGRLAVVIGDVSDKGIPAALVMATCRTLLRVSMASGRPPGVVLAEVNDRIHPDIPPTMFVTCLLAMIDPMTGSMAIANAGHNLPYRVDGTTAHEIRVRGMPLGLMPDMFYEEVDCDLEPGESLVLTSDGLTEAHASNGDMFGTERLRMALGVAEGDLVSATLTAHASFVGPEWEQEDDMTMVTMSRAPVPVLLNAETSVNR